MSFSRPHLLGNTSFLMLILAASPSLYAEPIQPWQGASAQAVAVGQHMSQQGTNADAYAEGQTRLYYSSPNNLDPNAFNVVAYGTAHAQVLGTADALLRVDATYLVDNPGTLPRGFHGDVPTLTTAEASWIRDRIHLEPGANGMLPDSIRLGVTLTGPNAWSSHSGQPDFGGNLDVQLGSQHFQLNRNLTSDIPFNGGSTPPDISAALVKLGFDSAKMIPTRNTFQAKAFLNLAVDASGWSEPFDLSLKHSLDGYPWSNGNLNMNPGAATLSLDDITLSDGTSVTAAGYNVTFDSGLAWPVPEPASVACWTALVAAAGWLSRRRAKITLAGV